MRPTEYVQTLRVAAACALPETANLGVEAVAWKVGYGDVGAFRRVFQRLLGLSPGAYRRRFRPGPMSQGAPPVS